MEILQQRMVEILGQSSSLLSRLESLEERITTYEFDLRSSIDFDLLNNKREYLQFLYSETDNVRSEKDRIDTLHESLTKQIREELVEKRKAQILIDRNVSIKAKDEEKVFGKFMDEIWLIKQGSR